MKFLFMIAYDNFSAEIPLAKGLIENGHEVEFVTSNVEPKYMRRVGMKNIRKTQYKGFVIHKHSPLFEIPTDLSIPFVPAFSRYFNKKHDLIIVSLVFQFYSFQYLVKKAFGKAPATVFWSHLIPSSLTRSWMRIPFLLYLRIMGFLMRNELILTTSKENQKLLKSLGFRNFFYFPFSTNTNLFRPGRVPGEKVRILFGGRLEKHKGMYDLIKAVSLLDKKTRSMVELTIWGKGPELENLMKDAEKLNLKKITNFMSEPIPYEETPKVYHRHDIFVLPSYLEGGTGPLSILEAASCGLPIIATKGNTGGVMDNETGFLIEPGNIDMLKSCIEKLAMSKELRESMGRKGRELMVRDFDYRSGLSRFEELAKKLCSKKP